MTEEDSNIVVGKEPTIEETTRPRDKFHGDKSNAMFDNRMAQQYIRKGKHNSRREGSSVRDSESSENILRAQHDSKRVEDPGFTGHVSGYKVSQERWDKIFGKKSTDNKD